MEQFLKEFDESKGNETEIQSTYLEDNDDDQMPTNFRHGAKKDASIDNENEKKEDQEKILECLKGLPSVRRYIVRSESHIDMLRLG